MAATDIVQERSGGKGRLDIIDLARGLALVTMAVYHFAWDLEFFGYVPAGMTQELGWRLFARSIAGSFLFLVGISLVLAHVRAIRWRPFLSRLAMVAGAAAAISLATYLAMPDDFIFFGILHHIALASLLGLAFLRAPPALVGLVALLALAAPWFLRAPVFAHPALWWVGLAPTHPHSNDYVPLVPWFGCVLAGILFARIAFARGWFEAVRGWSPGRPGAPLLLAGRHSLFFYLAHQPILIGALWLFAFAAPPQAQAPDTAVTHSCEAECAAIPRPEAFCSLYCTCMVDGLASEGLADDVFGESPRPDAERRLQVLAEQCSVDAERMARSERPR